LHNQDAPGLREAAHKFCGTLSAFSTVAGDQAADLEDLAARGMLNEAHPVVEQLDRRATRTRSAGRRARDSKPFGSWWRLSRTPTGQAAPETAGWKQPTNLFLVSGLDLRAIRYGCPTLSRAVNIGDWEYP